MGMRDYRRGKIRVADHGSNATMSETPMKYGLMRFVLGSTSTVPISENEHQELSAARKSLRDALFLEEKFDLVLSNYLELETDLLTIAARDMVHNDPDDEPMHADRNLMNRRLVNLLGACRAYLDFARSAGKELLKSVPDSQAKFNEQFSHHYDTTLGYKVMEAMRNFVLHRGFPVQSVTYHSNLHEKEQRNRFSFNVSVYASVKYLREDGKFKSKVLDELGASGDLIDLKPLFRDYVACIALIHEELRNVQATFVTRWDEQIADAELQFKRAYPDEPIIGLVAVRIEGSRRLSEIYLNSKIIDRRKRLAQKNSSFKNFANRYVTSAVKKN
jgi:hypothetical protein